MTFDTLARNWLALHGNFSEFDTSLLSEEGMAKLWTLDLKNKKYVDYFYFSAGYRGAPEFGLSPSKQFEFMSDFFATPVDKLCKKMGYTGAELKKVCNACGLHFEDCNSLGVFKQKTFKSISASDVLHLVYDYFYDPDNTCLVAVDNNGSETLITIFQSILYSFMQTKSITTTVESLLDMNLLQVEKTPNVKRVSLVGNVLYTSADSVFDECLRSVYGSILALCTPQLLRNISLFSLASLNECTGTCGKKVIKEYTIQMARAAAIDMTLNDIMNLFGRNIPDVAYGIQKFGRPTAVGSNDVLMQYDGDDKIVQCAGRALLSNEDGVVHPEVDVRPFLALKVDTAEPRRITID